MGELLEKLFSRLGVRAFSEYGVVGIVSVLVAYFVLLFVAKLIRYTLKKRDELGGWSQMLGSVEMKSQTKTETIHSGVCAAVLLIVAFTEWPYSVYILLRVFVCGSAAYIASRMYSQHRVPLTWVAGAIAVLYNPILPVRMERSDWQAVNLLTAIPFIGYSLYLNWESPSQKRSRRLQQSRIVVRAAAAICTRMKGRDIRILELAPTDSALADFFVVTSAINHRRAIAIADEVELRLKNDWGLSPISDNRAVGWILLDYVDFAVHIFLKQQRAYYGIESARTSAQSFEPEQFQATIINPRRA